MASIGWREIKRLAAQIPGHVVRESDRMELFSGGGWVQAKSADNPDSLRGEGLDLVALDECAFIREAAWQEALRPALSDRRGQAIFISTPKGQNWFWRLYQQGVAGNHDIRSWSFPTSNNPYIARREIDAARASLPERIFLQEYEAQFIDDAGGVFRNVLKAATAMEQLQPIEGHQYVMGVDWARTDDATVFSVIDITLKAEAFTDRMLQTDYASQLNRLRALWLRFGQPPIVAETNSMGGPLVERLQLEAIPIIPFQTGLANKAHIIDALQLAFERGDLAILNNAIGIGELQAYQFERLPGGGWRYGAPAGMHDDYVIALALAWHGMYDSGPLFYE